MKSIKLLSILLSASLFFFGSCNNNGDDFDEIAQYNKEVAAIDEYLDANFPDAIKDPSGIRIVIKTLGTGLPAQLLSTINIDYKGTLFSNGTTFEESTANGQLVGYIYGWQYAFTILPVGSEATIYIPSALAYRNGASAKIPANSTLVFDVKFKSMTQPPVYNSQFTQDTTAIKNYLTSKGITATKDPKGVWYNITSPGVGQTPSLYDPVKLTYTFKLLSADNTVIGTFDREPTSTFSSRVVDYIQGVGVILTKLPEGGKATAYIPSGLAFGINSFRNETGAVVIPPNSNVIIEIELKDIL
jgi:FKBP-type peptidyl-prolyl cis-trans isomerase